MHRSGLPTLSVVLVTLSGAGIETIFEILPAYFIFEKVAHPSGLERILEQLATHDLDIIYVVKVQGIMFWDKYEKLELILVYCTAPILKSELQYLRKAGRSMGAVNIKCLRGSWALARLLATGSSWFLSWFEMLPLGVGYHRTHLRF